MRRAGNRLRVTAQLINASDGYHLWSERFDREMTDVFAIQDEIAQAIAAALQVKLSAETATLRRYTPKLPAYEAYLKALHCLSTLVPDKLERGKEWLEQAIELDPGFALAHCFLGLYFLRLALPALLPAHEAMPRVRRAARAALSIDPTLPEAHALLGVVAAVYDYDWNEAERLFRLAMSRDPVPFPVRVLSFLYLLPVGRLQDAINEQERALKDDPLNQVARFQLASCLQIAGKDAQAAAEFRQILELDENFWLAPYSLGLKCALQGMLTEAMDFAERAHSLAPWSSNTTGLLAAVLVRSGDRIRAQDLLQKLGDGPVYSAPGGFIVYHLLCSEVDRAVDWAEKAIEQRDPRVGIFHRFFEQTWRSSPRWPALAKKMNLPEAG